MCASPNILPQTSAQRDALTRSFLDHASESRNIKFRLVPVVLGGAVRSRTPTFRIAQSALLRATLSYVLAFALAVAVIGHVLRDRALLLQLIMFVPVWPIALGALG